LTVITWRLINISQLPDNRHFNPMSAGIASQGYVFSKQALCSKIAVSEIKHD